MLKKINFLKILRDFATCLGIIAKHLIPVFVLIPMMVGVFSHEFSEPIQLQKTPFCQIVAK